MANTSAPVGLPPPPFAAVGADPRGRQLIEAAYALLDEAGLEGLTIRAVLTRTGLARRAFYDNFTSKDDLLLVVFEQTMQLAARHYREVAATLPSPLERLQMMITSIAVGSAKIDAFDGSNSANGHRHSAAMSREHLRLAESRPGELKAALAPLRAVFVEIIEDGIANGELRAADVDLQTTLIYNLVSTTAHAELLAADNAPPDHDRRRRLAVEVWEFCRRAIAV